MPSTVTRSSGRMSQAAAYSALQTVRAIADTFPGHAAAQKISSQARAYSRQDSMPGKDAVLALQDELNSLVADRLLQSASLPPATAQAITVYLFGTESPHDIEHAAHVAAEGLRATPGDLRLVDATPVQTATYVGTRYTFRTASPYDAPSAPLHP